MSDTDVDTLDEKLDLESISQFAGFMEEAIAELVDGHPEQFDKRAAEYEVEEPSIDKDLDGSPVLKFELAEGRGGKIRRKVLIGFEPDQSGELSVAAVQHCECDEFESEYACEHTLACAWWLQQHFNRRGAADLIVSLTEAAGAGEDVSVGGELVEELLKIAESDDDSDGGGSGGDDDEAGGRIQWRLTLSESRYFSPIQITPYFQRPKKNGKGYTKGRQIREYDLLYRDYADSPLDGRLAVLMSTPQYSMEDRYHREFQALELLVGADNVGDDDGEPVRITRGTIRIVMEIVDGEEPTEDDDGKRYRPVLRIDGLAGSLSEYDTVLGEISPAEPALVVVDEPSGLWTLCRIPDRRALRMVRTMLMNIGREPMVDRAAAAAFAVRSHAVDRFVPVELPEELAGPVREVAPELVLRLTPRRDGGMRIEPAMHDDRFRDVVVPGRPPETVSCLTEDGPVRLRRDLAGESATVGTLVERLGLGALPTDGPMSFLASSDDAALELLGKIHAMGDEAPRLIWPEGERFRVRGDITPSNLKVQIDDNRDWFGLDGSVTVDGRTVPLAELLAAVRTRRALVRVGDGEFARINEEFRQRLEMLGDAVVEERGALKIADAVAPVIDELVGDDVAVEATERWHSAIAKINELRDWNPDQPEGLDADLRQYQLEGYRWLARLSRWCVGGVLADDMGLGKTVQTLGVLLDRASEGPALVVAPTSVGDNWIRETNRFAPSLTPRSYRDSDRQDLVDSATDGDLVIVSYQLLQRDAERFAGRSWGTLVLDEAQFIKNSNTKTARAVRSIDAAWRLGLSGTPLENHLGELWSLFRTLSPGLLGSWERFRKRFAEPIERQKDPTRRESLAGMIRPFVLRRTKNAVLKELPPRTEITLKATLSGKERELYEATRVAALSELSEPSTGQAGQKRIKTLAWLTKLRQLACHPRLVEAGWRKDSAKLELLMELVAELREGGHRALVFSQFVRHLELVRRSLDDRGVTYQYLDGSTPAAARQERVDKFQEGDGDLFLISLKAGGTGLNLTAADYVVHLDPWWNPAVEDQATDRAHRIGQTKPVTVYRLVAEETIEEKILQLHADKRELVSGVLDGTDAAAKLDTGDLIDLIRGGQ